MGKEAPKIYLHNRRIVLDHKNKRRVSSCTGWATVNQFFFSAPFYLHAPGTLDYYK